MAVCSGPEGQTLGSAARSRRSGPSGRWLVAFAATWLPGTEGGGVADVLFGDAPAVGTPGFSWPRSADQLPFDAGAATYDPLFPFGFSVPLRSVT